MRDDDAAAWPAQDRFVAELDECCWLDVVLHPLATSDVRPRVCCLPCVASAVHTHRGGGDAPRTGAANDDHCAVPARCHAECGRGLSARHPPPQESAGGAEAEEVGLELELEAALARGGGAGYQRLA